MKMGMIFECGPDGADQKVCEHLAQRLLPETEIVSVTLDNKPKLLNDCGPAAARLLQESCQRIVIVWDLYPPWRQNRQRPCRREDREAIRRSLTKARVPLQRASLVCIEEELEAWLIADSRALTQVLSRFTHPHPVRVQNVKKPERMRNPKKYLIKVFREYRRVYSDLTHAKMIVEALPDLTRLRRCTTFARFEVKVTGQEP